MFPQKSMFIALGVVITTALPATYCLASPIAHEITEQESQKLAEVLAGAGRYEFPPEGPVNAPPGVAADAELPVDETETCKPPRLGQVGECAPTLNAHKKLKPENIRQAKGVTKPADKNAEEQKL